jgi:hypothetical protein
MEPSKKPPPFSTLSQRNLFDTKFSPGPGDYMNDELAFKGGPGIK